MWLQVTEITSHLVELKRGPNVSLPPHIQTSLYYAKAFSWEDLKLPFMTSPEQVFQFNKSSLSSFSSLSRLFFVLSRKTYIGLFADDSTYFRTISDPSDFSILLKDLDSLHGVRHTFDCFGSPDILFHFVVLCPVRSQIGEGSLGVEWQWNGPEGILAAMNLDSRGVQWFTETETAQ